jgi:PLP dependent protein
MGGRSLAENLELVRGKIRTATQKSKRSMNEIKIVAVSKKKSSQVVREAVKCGLKDFGENYVQELTAKVGELADVELNWHYIGSLQRNKCKEVVGKVALIHSVDRLELANELSKTASDRGVVQDVLLQINYEQQESKIGFSEREIRHLAVDISRLPGICVRGLMTFPPLFEDPELARGEFRRVKEIRNELQQKIPTLKELSMGTSSDYQVAIEEGATIVRIGTEIFGQREK